MGEFHVNRSVRLGADDACGILNRAVVNRLSQVFLMAMGLRFLWRGLAS